MKIIILDFSTAEVHVFPYDKNVWSDPEDFIEDMNENGPVALSLSNCQYMIVDNLQIQIHTDDRN
jgi:hypothetical protein